MQNYFMCINYRYYVVVVLSIIDLASKIAEKPPSTHMVVKLLTDDRRRTDGSFGIAIAHTFAKNKK